jgi:hypothetical protein
VGGIEPFLHAIPIAAKSPFALFAYAISALLFIVSVYHHNQLKSVLLKINKIPQEDRKSVIETTLNTKLPERLSGEQFLRRERTKYIFLAFISLLVSLGAVTVIALVGRMGTPTVNDRATKIAKVRVQLWPRPEIKRRFLKDHDARLYLKSDNKQLDMTGFVPTDDFLDATVDIEDDLIGKPVDLTIAPRDKYVIQQDRRFLTRLVRLEVYPLGKKAVPAVTSLVTPSGETVLRTTNLPFSSAIATINMDFIAHPDAYEIVASKPYLLDVKGQHLSSSTKVGIVDDKGQPVRGAWAGNELGTSNGRPVEVNADGKSLRVYIEAPPSAAGQKLFWRIENSSNEVAMAPVTVLRPEVQQF